MPCRPSSPPSRRSAPPSAIFRDDPTETWRVEAVREAGVGEDELTGALALAAMVSGIEPPALLAGPIEAEGWLARTFAGLPRGADRPPLPGPPDPCAEPRHLWPDRAEAGCRAGLRHGRARFDPGLPDCLRGDGASEATADPGPRHGVGDPRHRRGQMAEAAGAGDGYRALVGPRRGGKCDAERGATAAGAEAGGWLEEPGDEGRSLRPGLRQYPGPAALRHGEGSGAASGAGGTAILAGLLGTQARMVLAAHRRQGLVLDGGSISGPWTTLVLRRR